WASVPPGGVGRREAGGARVESRLVARPRRAARGGMRPGGGHRVGGDALTRAARRALAVGAGGLDHGDGEVRPDPGGAGVYPAGARQPPGDAWVPGRRGTGPFQPGPVSDRAARADLPRPGTGRSPRPRRARLRPGQQRRLVLPLRGALLAGLLVL